MRKITGIITICLLSSMAFGQSSASNVQASKQTTVKPATSTQTKSTSQKASKPGSGQTWYYCQVCGHKYTAPGKCPAEGSTLVQKTIR